MAARVVGQALCAPAHVMHVGERIGVEDQADWAIGQKVNRQAPESRPTLSGHGDCDNCGHEKDGRGHERRLAEGIRDIGESQQGDDNEHCGRVPRQAERRAPARGAIGKRQPRETAGREERAADRGRRGCILGMDETARRRHHEQKKEGGAHHLGGGEQALPEH